MILLKSQGQRGRSPGETAEIIGLFLAKLDMGTPGLGVYHGDWDVMIMDLYNKIV